MRSGLRISALRWANEQTVLAVNRNPGYELAQPGREPDTTLYLVFSSISSNFED
jgi:hypothetical protein